MKNLFIIIIFIFTSNVNAQKYEFTNIVDLETTSVKNQGKTGTCWSFSTSSFIENEIFRLSKKHVDVSEMYTVRKIYEDKAWNYVMRQGKAQFSQGGLAHDVINAIDAYGLVPENVFSGTKLNGTKYDHSKIVPSIKKILDAYIKNDKDSKHPDWKKEIATILDDEIGIAPTNFVVDSISFTPKTFAKSLHFDKKNYITLTSFTHVPFYTNFILSIPDNFSNGSMYNLPIHQLFTLIDEALKDGFTVALDVDVSEKTFSAKNGIAVLPLKEEDAKKALTEIVEEKTITQKYRQQEFENYNTTDDHLMHIVGIVRDQKWNKYFKIKNSWGGDSDRVGNGGYIYMSIPYFKLKMISVLVHKTAIQN